MEIKTKYNIGDRVIALRTKYTNISCETCHNYNHTKEEKFEDVAKIERIEIFSENEFEYLLRFENGNGGAMSSYKEDKIIGRDI